MRRQRIGNELRLWFWPYLSLRVAGGMKCIGERRDSPFIFPLEPVFFVRIPLRHDFLTYILYFFITPLLTQR